VAAGVVVAAAAPAEAAPAAAAAPANAAPAPPPPANSDAAALAALAAQPTDDADQAAKTTTPAPTTNHDDNGTAKDWAAEERDGPLRRLAPREPPHRLLDVRGKTILAPLTTVGNLPFRRLCVGLGADITYGEMAMATNLLQGQASEWALLKRHPSERCFVAQVAGGYADAMAHLAQAIDDSGLECDAVDINAACPIDVVCGRGAGAALTTKPRKMEQVVRTMAPLLTRCPLTIKMRRGYSDGQDTAHSLIPSLARWAMEGYEKGCDGGGETAAANANADNDDDHDGAASRRLGAVTVHGRSRAQRYSREADWGYLRGPCHQAALQAGVPLIGSGDVLAPQDLQAHLDGLLLAEGAAAGGAEENGGGDDSTQTPSTGGLSACMVARGALIKPWIFTEIKEQRLWDISAGERLDLLKQFASHGLEHWGADSRGVETTRRFLLELLSFSHRYVPVALLEVLPQRMNWRPPRFCGRSDLETMLASDSAGDWVRLSEMLLGPAPAGFTFAPKHKANAYAAPLVVGGGGGGGGGGRVGGAGAAGAAEDEENG